MKNNLSTEKSLSVVHEKTHIQKMKKKNTKQWNFRISVKNKAYKNHSTFGRHLEKYWYLTLYIYYSIAKKSYQLDTI